MLLSRVPRPFVSESDGAITNYSNITFIDMSERPVKGFLGIFSDKTEVLVRGMQNSKKFITFVGEGSSLAPALQNALGLPLAFCEKVATAQQRCNRGIEELKAGQPALHNATGCSGVSC